MSFLSVKNNIIAMVDELIKNEGTTNPMDLIKNKKNLTFQYSQLSDNVKGYYLYISEKKQILAVNETLQGCEKQFTLFHEFGHCIMKHKGDLLLNSFSTESRKQEYMADLFATYMFVVHNHITKDNVNDFILPKRARELIHNFL